MTRFVWSLHLLAIAAICLGLTACGGGGSQSGPAPAPSAPLTALVDSFGVRLAEEDFGNGDAGAAGVDGTAAEGAAIAHARVSITDTSGRVVTTLTDSQGYYRVRVDGFVAPLLATVTRPDGTVWRSPSATPVQPRAFVTLNISPLTDKLASDVATAAGLGGSADLTPPILARHPGELHSALEALRTALAAQIADAGLQRSTFDPVSQPFRPGGGGVDAVLDNVLVGRNTAGATVMVAKFVLGGTVSGLGADTGLVIANGEQTVSIAPNATSFRFSTTLPQGADYNATVARQPAVVACLVQGASGKAGADSRSVLRVECSDTKFRVGGSITGLAGRSGLALTLGSEVLPVAAGTTDFVFASRLPIGAPFDVQVAAHPLGAICTVSDGTAKMQAADVTQVRVTCTDTVFSLGGTVEGLTSPGLVLTSGGQSLVLAAGASGFEFPVGIASGTSFSVTVKQQPAGNVCTVQNGDGVMNGPSGRSVAVRCVPALFKLSVSLTGQRGGGLVLNAVGQDLAIDGVGPVFDFPQPVPYGTPYFASVAMQPRTGFASGWIGPSYWCTVNEHQGVIVGNTVIPVHCDMLYAMEGVVDGLTGSGLVIALARGDVLAIPAAATSSRFFEFPARYVYGASYAASIQTQPGGNTCTILNPSGLFLPERIGFNGGAARFLKVSCSQLTGGP